MNRMFLTEGKSLKNQVIIIFINPIWKCYLNIFVALFKVIRNFFLNHYKSFRWHLGDYEKHSFFPFEGLWEEKLCFFVCSYGCIVGPCSYTCLGLSRTCTYTDPLHIRKNTQKSKFLLSQAFVIPEMPSKTFVMV